MSFWISFWLTNIHFAVELFGAVTFLVIIYVLLGVWLSKKQPKIALRILGFVLLVLYCIVNSGGSTTDFISNLLLPTKFLAFVFIAISFFIDPVQPPPDKAGASPPPQNPPPQASEASKASSSPPASAFLIPVFLNIGLGIANLVLLVMIILRIYLKYAKGLEKELKNLFRGFVFLFLAELVSSLTLFEGTSYVLISKLITDFGPAWIASHVLQLIGFIFIATYAWGYLRFKLFSQVIGAFVATSLFIFVAVTFVYTSLLVRNMQQNSLENLKINLQTFGYAVDRLKEQTLVTSSLIASDEAIEEALGGEDTERLSSLVQEQMVSSGVDFLAVVNSDGRVLARGEDPEAVSESLSENAVVEAALAGETEVNIATKDWVNAPLILIEASAPTATSGAVYTGYIVDNAFVDGVKEATGLDITIFGGDTKSATTLVSSDGVSRLVGVKETNEKIKNPVLENGELYLGLSKVFQKEYLAAYGPLKDLNGNILGMLFVGYPSAALLEAAQASLNTTFYITSLLAILSFIPAYFLAKFIEEHQV